jgi:hypothetical protein
MKVRSYEHNASTEALNHSLLRGVVDAVESVKFTPKKKSSVQLKAEVLGRLQALGWAGEVVIDASSGISITSVRKRTGLCFQTGNMARMYADILKLQTVFSKRVIDDAALIIPTKSCAKALGSNIANFDRLTRELQIFRSVITVPLLVLGVE